MPYVEWRMRGPEIANCNCDWGCPCQFNALPTHGDCRAMTAMRIDEGYFGDVSLSGVVWAGMFASCAAVATRGMTAAAKPLSSSTNVPTRSSAKRL